MAEVVNLRVPYPSSPWHARLDRHTGPTNPFIEFKRCEVEQDLTYRFEQQVREHCDRLAVMTQSQQLTYEELNRWANRVARTILAQRGEGAEPIALLFEHGIPAIVALLGVLKAGKSYVPLDASYPLARITHILEDSQAGLLVTNDQNRAIASELIQDPISLLNIDDMDADLSTENLNLPISPDTLAYIFYTSGSTGQPKGVVQTHRNVMHQLMTYTNSLHISPDDRLTLLHSYGFSASRLDIFGALLNGAALFPFALAEEGLSLLAPWLIEHEITLCHWIPTAFRRLVETLSAGEVFSRLRLMVLGSEPVLARDVALYKEHFPQSCLLVNRFGTTETGNACLYFIDKQTQVSGRVVPVGYPLEDTEVLLLDEDGNAVEDNHKGEIAIESRYLSPGYWRRPELNHTVFPPAPAAGDARIYRTGDLGYLLPDGCLVHLGRRDAQVKIRGYRVEVEEIKGVLLEHVGVQEAAVVVQAATPEDKRLVAYVVPAQASGLTPTALRDFLRSHLPTYMIPAAFVLLESLPLTPTGKVDRQALVPPDPSRPELTTPFASPRTPVEVTIAKLWAELLGLEQVGIHDDFLELGGHSLLAMQLIMRVLDMFHIEIPLQTLLASPTVADMAVIITQRQAVQVEHEEMSRLLAQIERLSEEEAQRLRLTPGSKAPE
jgi:amino acid adenylation domain-containing protein